MRVYRDKDGEEYRPVPMRIRSKNVRGVAKDLELIEDDQEVSLADGDEFVAVLFPVKMLEGTI